MADRANVLTQHLKQAIQQLEQLHVLAQTEALVLETANLAELEPLVQEKARLISRMDEDQRNLSAMLAHDVPSSGMLPAESRVSLDMLKQRALLLMELIGTVDEGNRFNLERFRAEAVQSAQVLHQDQKLRGAYTSAEPVLSHFSRLAD